MLAHWTGIWCFLAISNGVWGVDSLQNNTTNVTKKNHVTFTHCVIFWRAKKKNENLHVMREKGCITIQSGYTFIQFYTYYTHPHTNGVNLQLHFIHTQSILLCLCASILKEKEIIFRRVSKGKVRGKFEYIANKSFNSYVWKRTLQSLLHCQIHHTKSSVCDDEAAQNNLIFN